MSTPEERREWCEQDGHEAAICSYCGADLPMPPRLTSGLSLYCVGVTITTDDDDWETGIDIVAANAEDARLIARERALDYYSEYMGEYRTGDVEVGSATLVDTSSPGVLGFGGMDILGG